MSYGNFSIWYDLQHGKSVGECICELRRWYPRVAEDRAQRIVQKICDYGPNEPIDWDVV